jgi:transposase
MKEKGRKRVMGRSSTYDDAFKIAIAREYLTGEFSYDQLAKRHNLPGPGTTRHFVNWYKRWLNKNETDPEEPARQTAEETLGLEGKLKQANLRITALEMLIKVAEEELGIQIIKKSGTKQQDK